MDLMSLANGNSNAHEPNSKIAKLLIMVIVLAMSMYCIRMASKNPMGLCVSNGNLYLMCRIVFFMKIGG